MIISITGAFYQQFSWKWSRWSIILVLPSNFFLWCLNMGPSNSGMIAFYLVILTHLIYTTLRAIVNNVILGGAHLA